MSRFSDALVNRVHPLCAPSISRDSWMSALVKIVPGYRLKTHHHVVARSGRLTSCQWSSHSVPGSSRNGSHPPSRSSDIPNEVGATGRLRLPRGRDASSNMPVTKPQWRIDDTMFLPTPSFTMASSASNAYGSAAAASTAFLSHGYRNGNVSWPENETRSATITLPPLRSESIVV